MEKNNNLFAIFGAFIGGVVATIPWVFMYVYGNMILSLLATLIAFGVLKGYKLFKGTNENILPKLIIIISLVCVTIATLIVIPLMLLAKENLNVNFENLKLLYSDGAFLGAIIKDYIISIFFTILGISGVVSSLKKKKIQN